eukprot:6843068-Ditylum_brightwellii.AAC.1
MGFETKVRVSKIKEDWVDKSKGLKQVLYEPGFLDLENIHPYTKDGHKDKNDKVLDDRRGDLTPSARLLLNVDADITKAIRDYNLLYPGPVHEIVT